MKIEYKLAMYAQLSKEFLIQESVMSGEGVRVMLRRMTEMNRDERNDFMAILDKDGSNFYIPEPNLKLQYSIAVSTTKVDLR